MAVIASEARQSSVLIKRAFLDCRVAALLAMTNLSGTAGGGGCLKCGLHVPLLYPGNRNLVLLLDNVPVWGRLPDLIDR
jgi:hypothetical protein